MEEEVTGKEVKLGGGGVGAGEVDFKTKAGTAWSHSYLNQKPWHPLSYPNQRRKWIAEQVTANHSRRQEEVAREFAQEQEFFRQTALFNKKDKEKVEMMKAVSFMYVRPPGYNAESAKAAEISDENKSNATSQDPTAASSSQPDTGVDENQPIKDRKVRPKDVFGRALPTEQEFEVLKNAPRLDTGVAARSKPFAVEIRNVKCVRCGTFGHQSGDRECPLKDVIMPNDESRLKRDDPLNAILAQTDTNEPLKWELKQKPGMSPPRGGFRPDDPNQQIVADHDEIFDEYGGFLTSGDIPALLSNFSPEKPKKERRKHQCSKSKSKQKQHSSSDSESESEPNKSKRSKRKHKKHYCSDSDEAERSRRRSKGKHKSRNLSESSPSLSEDDEFRQAGRYDGRHYSSRRSKKRESEHLEKDTGRSKSTEARSNKIKDEKHVTAHSDRSEPDSDCQRHHRHRRHRHHHCHHSRHR
ncbi:zinc knuckle (CCHC-type) family protein [Carex rostrata]